MTLELFGMARMLVGAPAVDLDVADGSTIRDLLAALARAHPPLVGTVLEATTFAPLEPNAVLLDGRRARGLDERINAADRPVLLLIPSGG